MAKKFGLQPVLNYRELREAEAQQRLSEARQYEAAALRQHTACRTQLAELCRAFEAKQREGIAMADFQLHQARISGVEARLQGLDSELARARQEVAERRTRLEAAARDTKLLERLKEKFGEEVKAEQNRQESRLLDEIALQAGKGEL